MPIFGSSKKSPTEIIKLLKEHLQAIEKPPTSKKAEKMHEEVLKQIGNIKSILFSQSDSDQPSESVLSLCREMIDAGLMDIFFKQLAKMDFESKKEFVIIFANLLRKQVGGKNVFVEHLLDIKDSLNMLLENYSNPEVSLNTGMILRECLKYQKIAQYFLDAAHYKKLFVLISDNSFDVGSDAYLTFKELMTRHKDAVADFLESQYDMFFEEYNKLLNSENYVTKRQSIKLLGELLVERLNYKILVKYVANPSNLKLIMTLLKDKSSNVQFEAFHVFKIFVVNPNRSPAVTTILCRNRQLLVGYLSTFHDDRKDDDQFVDEREYVLRQIREMREPV